MTNEEFSNEFDILINNINVGLEFDEYEKSVYLTKAQEEVVEGLYTGKITLNRIADLLIFHSHNTVKVAQYIVKHNRTVKILFRPLSSLSGKAFP